MKLAIQEIQNLQHIDDVSRNNNIPQQAYRYSENLFIDAEEILMDSADEIEDENIEEGPIKNMNMKR